MQRRPKYTDMHLDRRLDRFGDRHAYFSSFTIEGCKIGQDPVRIGDDDHNPTIHPVQVPSRRVEHTRWMRVSHTHHREVYRERVEWETGESTSLSCEGWNQYSRDEDLLLPGSASEKQNSLPGMIHSRIGEQAVENLRRQDDFSEPAALI